MSTSTYTVIGLIDDDSNRLLVAGVVRGATSMTDNDETPGFTRWASSYEASSPEEAERLALAEVEEGDEEPEGETCSQCAEEIDPADMWAGHGMCGSCLHNAERSGWHPGKKD